MGKKAGFLFVGMSVICLFAACLLCYGGRKTGYRFQKMKEECREKWETGQEKEQKIKQKMEQQTEQDWVVEEDVEGPYGGKLSYSGRFLLTEKDTIFVAGFELDTGAALFGGENVPDKEEYNIYRLKDGIWEVFASHPPESVNNEEIKYHCFGDVTSVRNLICYDGFLYYSLLYDDEPGMGGDRPEYIYRIPVQGGEAEELALAYDTFCIYKEKIYYIGVEGSKNGWEYVCWEMEPDGKNRRAVYRRREAGNRKCKVFSIGGGCLYMEGADENGITRVNLDTGDIKYYNTLQTDIVNLYYENGYLYILTDDHHNGGNIVWRMDVVTGEIEQLVERVDYFICLENGYLYYLWHDPSNGNETINVLNLDTGRSSAETLEEKGNSHMRIVDDKFVVITYVYGENWNKEKDIYYIYKINTLPLERLDRKEVPVKTP